MILTDWEGIWMEKWFVAMKKADFNGIAEKYQISPIIARLMRNRDVIGDEAIDFYLNGTVDPDINISRPDILPEIIFI